MKPILIAFPVAALFCACGSVGSTYSVEPLSVNKTFSSPLNKELEANTGDDIFVYGTVSKMRALKSSKSIEGKMPGGMGLPFDFSVKRSVMKAVYQTDKHIFFAAPWSNIAASHSLYGSVLREGDFIGIRVHKQTGAKDWVVDNSNWNRITQGYWSKVIWSKPVNPGDGVTFEEATVDVFDNQSSLVQITYDGYFNKLIHFTLTEIEDNDKSEKEFAFDIDKNKFPVRIGIKGHVLDVTSVDNVRIKYKWVKMNLPKAK